MLEKIKNAKADTLVRVNNVIYAKVSDAENSSWRSAFGVMYANAFINHVLQSNNVEFLTNEPIKQVKKVGRPRKIVENPVEEIVSHQEECDVPEEESD